MALALAIGVMLLCQAEASQDKPAPEPAPEKSAAPPTQEPFFKTLIKQVSLGGQIRIRDEYRYPTGYVSSGAMSPSDDTILTRIRLNLKFSVTDDIEVFVQPQDQRTWGQELVVLSDNKNFDLHQGFVEIRNLFSEPLSIKAGRMELSYGDQRLVSPLDWSNFGRAWDGAKIRYAPKDWWIEAFFSVLNDPLAPAVFNGGGRDQDFLGLYFSYIGLADHEFDLYYFGREWHDGSLTGTIAGEVPGSGNLADRTIGARIKGKALGLDYTAEAMYQSGLYSADRINAYAYAGTLGYTFDISWKPRLGIEYDFASGDQNPTDGRRNTFDPLFPFGHYYQGFADVFAFKNGRDLVGSLKAMPCETLTLEVDYHTFWLANPRDAWYNAGSVLVAGVPTNLSGGVIRRDPTGAAGNQIGSELDLHGKLAVGKFVKFWGGWSHFFVGSFVRATPGQTVGMNWFFLQMTVDF
jgi:hypothetical protein